MCFFLDLHVGGLGPCEPYCSSVSSAEKLKDISWLRSLVRKWYPPAQPQSLCLGRERAEDKAGAGEWCWAFTVHLITCRSPHASDSAGGRAPELAFLTCSWWRWARFESRWHSSCSTAVQSDLPVIPALTPYHPLWPAATLSLLNFTSGKGEQFLSH